MKTLIVLLLIIFASLAFGAEPGIILDKGESFAQPPDVIVQRRVGTVTVGVINGEGPSSFYINVYISCFNYRTENGAPTLPKEIASLQEAIARKQKTEPCAYTGSKIEYSDVAHHDVVKVGFLTWMGKNLSHCPTKEEVKNDSTLVQNYEVDLKYVCHDFQP